MFNDYPYPKPVVKLKHPSETDVLERYLTYFNLFRFSLINTERTDSFI